MQQEQDGPRSGDGADTPKAATEAAAEAGQAALPLFYKEPQPLHGAVHGGKGLRQPGDYRFAAKAHAVVVHAQEFRLAAAHYPIVFADDDSSMSLAVLGYREGHNVFVDEAGRWAPGTYIPSYVRRYPFASGQGAKSDEAILYIDAASDLLVDLEADPTAQPLFAGGEPSEHTKRALEFCAAFQRQVPGTNAFVEAVKARELLQSREVKLDLPSGGNQLLTGLRIIEEEKFNALPDDVFLEWRRRGWVALVYWHWASMDNFRRMLERA